MKQLGWLIILLFFFPALSYAQLPSETVCEKKDTLCSMEFKAADYIGVSLIGVGVVGIAVTAVERDLLRTMVGETTRADYYICGGIAVAGLATLITSRILAVKKSRKYDVIPIVYQQGGGGLALKIDF